LKAQAKIIMKNTPNLNKGNNVEALKMKSLTMTNYEITKLAPHSYNKKPYLASP